MLSALLIILLATSCSKQQNDPAYEKWKAEILDTENEFTEMAQREGIPEAFLSFAADDVVVMRNDTLIMGKESLRANYEARKEILKHVNLSWKPDFVDVSAAGDLGYTYGKYLYTVTDSTGNTKEFTGVFHTVWKRQPDGQWKFVWD